MFIAWHDEAWPQEPVRAWQYVLECWHLSHRRLTQRLSKGNMNNLHDNSDVG
jgi:hypothetical protein